MSVFSAFCFHFGSDIGEVWLPEIITTEPAHEQRPEGSRLHTAAPASPTANSGPIRSPASSSPNPPCSRLAFWPFGNPNPALLLQSCVRQWGGGGAAAVGAARRPGGVVGRGVLLLRPLLREGHGVAGAARRRAGLLRRALPRLRLQGVQQHSVPPAA